MDSTESCQLDRSASGIDEQIGHHMDATQPERALGKADGFVSSDGPYAVPLSRKISISTSSLRRQPVQGILVMAQRRENCPGGVATASPFCIPVIILRRRCCCGFFLSPSNRLADSPPGVYKLELRESACKCSISLFPTQESASKSTRSQQKDYLQVISAITSDL